MSAQAPKKPNETPHESVLTQHKWSQIVPNYAYLDGCVTGYRAFVFTADGYFIFNGNVHGSWRLTNNNLVRLQTRSNGTRPGQILQLRFESDNTLSPIVATNTLSTKPPNPANGTFDFRRYDLFQECQQ
ncbi:MAG TPA: hypothetical protein VLV50_00540 [Stellaceae bacterium]|nr:hypothetical protein [Stellaceae bacterium]